ncbi:ketopantoate reductase family protein [Bacillus sp. FJAT-47783]|uniref:ketopantoate reductase family protein n=1 Tax=Bacillus sp. FJAT-47783 TaxID=2922712 RepID=UPI001FADBD12|nr:ketopantoate reductase family protein [Bacillus sp. FJAT-47783]
MNILVVGAGGVGGYFGGRLMEKGEDVTFLVRSNRKKQLEETGLVVRSIHGDFKINPKTLTNRSANECYDLIILSTKAYHLQEAIEDMKPFVGKDTIILPLLNGMKHIDVLKDVFGEEKVLGGLCFIETTLNEKGEIVQTSQDHHLKFGELNGEHTTRIEKLAEVFSNTKTEMKASRNILKAMWQKYMFISAFSGVTTLFQAPIGPIRETEYGLELIEDVLYEIDAIMKKVGAPLDNQIVAKQMKTIQKMEYDMKSSMQRDMEKKSLVEADHLQGYLLTLAEKHDLHAPILKMIYTNVKLYLKNHEMNRYKQ